MEPLKKERKIFSLKIKIVQKFTEIEIILEDFEFLTFLAYSPYIRNKIIFIIHILMYGLYRKRLNNGSTFSYACTLFMYEIHA